MTTAGPVPLQAYAMCGISTLNLRFCLIEAISCIILLRTHKCHKFITNFMKKLDKFFITTFVASLIMLSVISGVKRLRAADSNETTSTTPQGGVQQQQQQPTEQDRIVSPPNRPPNANAGPDKKVNEGATVNLDARRSSDPDTGNKITYSWKQLAGRPLDLGLSGDASTGFIYRSQC